MQIAITDRKHKALIHTMHNDALGTRSAKTERGWPYWILNVAVAAQAPEALTTLLLAADLFLLLTAYYVIRPVREALILGCGAAGAEVKSYTGAVHVALSLLIVPAHGVMASKVSRIRLINCISLLFVSNLVLFSLLGKVGVPLGVPFFLWTGIFSAMLIAQFWSFANDLYTLEQGRRLFAVIGIGGSAGATAGSLVARMLVGSAAVFQMMLVSAAILLIALLLTNLIHARERARAETSSERQHAHRPLRQEGAFRLMIHDRHLLCIGLLTLILNFVNTNGEYILGSTVSRAARATTAATTAGSTSTQEIIAGFYADFQWWQNLAGALFQIFLLPCVLRYLGASPALLIMPAVSLCAYGVVAAAPVLGCMRIAKILENSVYYSLQNTVRYALFLTASREAKYKVLLAVDTLFWRMGDALSGAAVFVGVSLLGLGARSFAIFNVGLAGTCLFLGATTLRWRNLRCVM